MTDSKKHAEPFSSQDDLHHLEELMKEWVG